MEDMEDLRRSLLNVKCPVSPSRGRPVATVHCRPVATLHCNGSAQTTALGLSVRDCKRQESFPVLETGTVRDVGVSPAHKRSRLAGYKWSLATINKLACLRTPLRMTEEEDTWKTGHASTTPRHGVQSQHPSQCLHPRRTAQPCAEMRGILSTLTYLLGWSTSLSTFQNRQVSTSTLHPVS